MQQEALEALVHRLRSGAASGADVVAVLRGMLPEGLGSLGDWQRLIVKALQTGRPVTVETEAKPAASRARKKRRATRSKPA